MCGITAYLGNRKAAPLLHDSLKRLDYRGYDSAGIATLSNPGVQIKKGTGKVDDIHDEKNFGDMEGTVGIGHSRWATHGEVSKENAHPHTSCDGRFALAHNGIIENHEKLKEELTGHEFTSDTDSEVIAHYIEERCGEGDVEGAIRDFMRDAKGSFAIALLDSEEEKLFAVKNGSPLVIGLEEDEIFIGSDVYAFSPYTNKTAFLGDSEYAVIDRDSLTFKDIDGKEIEKEGKTLNWEQEGSGRGDFEHYMLKEINEIPRGIEKLENSLKTTQKDRMKRFAEEIQRHGKVIFTAAGTSYHASLLGVYFLQKVGVEAQTLIASEFENYERVDENTLVVAVSQSGETKDVLEAMEYSRERGADVCSITNVPHSTVERKSDTNLRIEAGQEICVAATKTFTNQLFLLLKLAGELGYDISMEGFAGKIKKFIRKNEPQTKKLAKKLKGEEDVYVIGKGETYPVAREIALKLKEISYIHAEGMMGGELKHGTLALIEEGTPVVSLIPEEDSEILSNVKEVEARGARSIRISPNYGEFEVPEGGNGKFAFYSTVLGFLITYWTARERGLPVDKPRNLAKCVSVK